MNGVQSDWSQTPLDVVAIGGNSLIADAAHLSVADQYRRAGETARHLLCVIRDNARVLITHGNGPQVGFILLRSEIAGQQLHPVPLDSCVADTQGAIGYHLVQVLDREMELHGIARHTAALVTRCEVSEHDPAFTKPTKPIGPWITREAAEERCRNDGWIIAEEPGLGWRRLVASPEPLRIPEMPVIESLLDQGTVVVAAGGGGIPVVRTPSGELRGAAAVIDKDLASALLAVRLGARRLIITTGIECVALAYGTPAQRNLHALSTADARRYLANGEFPAGSMGPKIEAALRALEGGVAEVIITSPDQLEAALRGQTGTRIR